jgi:hypothetical protein
VRGTVEQDLAQERLDPHAVGLDRHQRVLVGKRPILEHDVRIIVPADPIAALSEPHLCTEMRPRQHL